MVQLTQTIFTQTCELFPAAAFPDYKKYTPAELAQIFTVGTRVKRGVDWQWGFQDGNGPGTVAGPLNFTTGMIPVTWDINKNTYSYRMGPPTNKYDLILYTSTTCPSLPSINNGLLSSNKTAISTTVTYTCLAGYFLQGPSTRTCRTPGVWDGLQPLCIRKSS